MNVTLWILQIVLALVFAGAGLMKLTKSLAELESKVGGWVHDVPFELIRLIGFFELVGAVGLIVPAATGIAPWLGPIAALALLPFMLGAMIVHGRRGETKDVAVNLVFALLLAGVAWGRLGPYAL